MIDIDIDPVMLIATVALVASEMLPLIDCTNANGILHGLAKITFKVVQAICRPVKAD